MRLPPITNKQKEILLLLYRFRFLNRVQIQKLLNHKSPKNTNVWLKDLTNKNYTKRIFEKKAGINDPAIYFISKNGTKFLRSHEGCEREYLKKLSQENRRSEAFTKQCTFIADIYIKLQKDNDPSFKFYTQSDFLVKGLIRDLQPSFAYIFEKNAKIEHFTCEILKESMPRYAIRARIRQYLKFFSEIQQMNIIFICASEKQAKYTESFSKSILYDADIESMSIKITIQAKEKNNEHI